MTNYCVRKQLKLSAIERIFLCEINDLAYNNPLAKINPRAEGACTAGNKHFADEFGYTERHAARIIASIEKKGFIKVEIDNTGSQSGGTIRYITPIDNNVMGGRQVEPPATINNKNISLTNTSLTPREVQECAGVDKGYLKVKIAERFKSFSQDLENIIYRWAAKMFKFRRWSGGRDFDDFCSTCQKYIKQSGEAAIIELLTDAVTSSVILRWETLPAQQAAKKHEEKTHDYKYDNII